MDVRAAWKHPWLQKYKTKINKIPRALAVESTLAYLSHSFTHSKLFSVTAYYITHFLMPVSQRNRITEQYLFYDKMRLGIVTLGDLHRVQRVGGIRIDSYDHMKILPKLGIETPFEH